MTAPICPHCAVDMKRAKRVDVIRYIAGKTCVENRAVLNFACPECKHYVLFPADESTKPSRNCSEYFIHTKETAPCKSLPA